MKKRRKEKVKSRLRVSYCLPLLGGVLLVAASPGQAGHVRLQPHHRPAPGPTRHRSLTAMPSLPAANRVTALRRVTTVALDALDNPTLAPAVEIELHSADLFPPQNQLYVLHIGAQSFPLSRYPKGGSLQTLIFTISEDAFARIAHNDPISVVAGFDPSNPQTKQDFGRVTDAVLRLLAVRRNP